MTRELRLDAVRGLLLVIMTVDHIGGPMTALTYQTFGFMSAAGGFFLLSGYVAGMVYTNRLDTKGAHHVRQGSRRRAWLVYRYHVGLMLAILAIILVAPGVVDAWRDHQPSHFEDPLSKMALGALLIHADRFGVLRLYVFFIALIPALVSACRRGQERYVVAASASVWLAVQLGLQDWLVEATGFGSETFSPLSWQVLFVAGIVLGCRRTDRGYMVPARDYDRRWLAMAMAVAATLFMIKWVTLAAYHLPVVRSRLGGFDEVVASLTERSSMAPLRLLNIAALVLLAGWAIAWRSRHPAGLAWLQLIGRHSLQVYVFQAALVQAWWLIEAPAERSLGLAAAVVPNLTAVALLTIPAIMHERWQSRSRHAADPAVAPAVRPAPADVR